MEPREIEKLLKEWAGIMQGVDKALGEMVSVFGGALDCDNANAIIQMADAYTEAVGDKVGDASEWLQYFWHECRLGENPLKVTFCDGSSILMDSVDALIETILAQ